MSSIPKLSIPGLNSKVLRTYRLGVSFEGDNKEKRAKEIEANNRVRGLQVRQEDMIYDKTTIDLALRIARDIPNKDSKFAPAAIQEYTKNYSNIGNSAYYQLFIAAKGTVDRENKVSKILNLLCKWNTQAIEWIVFGRSPRVENTLSFQWKLRRIYVINLLTSTRRQIDKFVPPNMQFNKKLPKLTKTEIKEAILEFYQIKHKELFSKNMTSKEKSFLDNLELLSIHSETFTANLQNWFSTEHSSHWRSLKKFCREFSVFLGDNNRNLFSSIRSIILFALSSKMEETVLNVIEKLNPEECVSPPFKTKRKGRLPIYLLMKKDYVVIRPGNAKKMTELALKDGFFELGFPLKGFTRINGKLIFSKKIRDYIRNGATIRFLRINHGKAPNFKIIVSVILEGTNSMFISQTLTLNLLKTFKGSSSRVLGLDINRISKYAITFSNKIEIPKELRTLIRRYNYLCSRIVPQLSYSLKITGRKKDRYKYCKLKGELERVYQKRKKILEEIKNFLPHYIAAVIVSSDSSFLCIESLEFDPRGKKGSLGKAFYSMPDECDIFEKAVLIASKLSGKVIRLIRVHPKGTSSYHYQCRGILEKEHYHHDHALCKKCGTYVNTHSNAAKNIREKGEKLLQSINRPSSHARVAD